MILDVARHKLYEAVITLCALALATVLSGIAFADVPSVGSGAPLGVLVDNFQQAHNVIASFVGFILIVHLTFGTTRAAVRSHLYGVNSFAPMSIVPLTLLLFASFGGTLSTIIIATLASEAIRRILYDFSSDRRRQAIFSAMFALGVMPLMDSALMVILFALPLMLISLRCSLRETIIAIAGMTMPILIYAYVVWYCGGYFVPTISMFYERMVAPASAPIVEGLSIYHLIVAALALLLVACAMVIYLRERMSMTLAACHAWRFISLAILILLVAFVVLPSTSVASLVVVAMLMCITLPILLLRLTTLLASLVYVVMLGCAVAAIL